MKIIVSCSLSQYENLVHPFQFKPICTMEQKRKTVKQTCDLYPCASEPGTNHSQTYIASRQRYYVTGKTITSGSVPAALSACGSQGIAFHSTPAFCSPWLCAWGCSPFAPPSSPTLPSAGHSAGRSSVPAYTV